MWIFVPVAAIWFGLIAFYPDIMGRYLLGMKEEEAKSFRDRDFIPKMAKFFFWFIVAEMAFSGSLVLTDFLSKSLHHAL